MGIVKSLTGQTAYYGISSMLGRLLNYLLVPLWTRLIVPPDNLAIVHVLYAWAALLNVLLTYGMETAFFRFSTDPSCDRKKVGDTAFTALLTTTTVALLLTLIGAIGTHGIMNALSTPENIFADGSLYLRVYVFGLLFLFIYNVCTGIFNAMGDSRTPLILLVLIALTVLSVRITGFDLAVLVKKGSKFFDILKAMFPPNTAYLGKIWQPLWDTIKMSILGSFVGAVLAVPFAVAAASNIVTNRVVVFLVRLFLSLVRTLPTLVCALIATYIFGLGTMAGTCAIAVFTFAYVGKQLFEIIETVDMGPYEAMEALGATRLRAFTTAVFPQVLPTYLSVSLFCLEGNVRYASILGYVGAGGLGLIMNEKIGWREYDSLGMILIVLFVTVMVIEGISHALRKRLT